jgi:hypothetical protein
MDQQTDDKKPSSTEGGQVKWSDKTRGGFWVRGIEPSNSGGYYCQLRGQVGNHSSFPPSDDPTVWTRETWSIDGRYMASKECGFDLVEAQGE